MCHADGARFELSIRVSAARRENRRRTLEQLREARTRVEQQRMANKELRRAEDRIREDSHDERSITVRTNGAPRNPERRHGRTDADLRRDLAEVQRQWEALARKEARKESIKARQKASKDE